MPWPQDDLSTANFDADTDKPSLARPMLVRLINAVKAIIPMRGAADGICDLDANGKVPDGRYLDTIPRLKNGKIKEAQLTDATAAQKGVTRYADAADLDAGTANRAVDAGSPQRGPRRARYAAVAVRNRQG